MGMDRGESVTFMEKEQSWYLVISDSHSYRGQKHIARAYLI